eukprot:XP_011674178.1 PREDICTED: transmembrane protein 106B isoform X3 [Strongylocentrotus purpuratus]
MLSIFTLKQDGDGGSTEEAMSDSKSEKQPLLDNTRNNVADSSSVSNKPTTTMRHRSNDLSAIEATLADPSSPNPSTPIPDDSNGNGIYTYEELSNGFTCPTCHGLGKIPRGREDDLVALIPYNDDRLKPRRTGCYVIISIMACAIIAGVLCGFLVPKAVLLSVDDVVTADVWLNKTTSEMRLQLQMEFSLANMNFVPVYAQNITVSAYWSDVLKGSNVTTMPFTLGGRHTNSQMFSNVTATFTESFLVSYCSGDSPTHVIYMQFVATLQFKLLSQNQQATMTHYSPVKCASLDQGWN